MGNNKQVKYFKLGSRMFCTVCNYICIVAEWTELGKPLERSLWTRGAAEYTKELNITLILY